MKFKIEITKKSIVKDVEVGTYEEAIKEFEQALWDEEILPEDESLTAADLGFGGGRTLAGILREQKFLNYGSGKNLPCISFVQEKTKAERTKEIFKRLEYSDTDWSLAADLFVRWNVEKDFLTESFEDFVDWIEEEELEGTVWTFFFGYQNEFRSFAEDWVDAAEVEEYLEFCRKAGYGDEDDDWLEIE